MITVSAATQQNASASEELAATSEELSGQAKQLQDSIAFFNVGTAAPKASARLQSIAQRRATPPSLASTATPAAVRLGRANGNFRPY
jgi:methyl-accepting chemotaxis protein